MINSFKQFIKSIKKITLERKTKDSIKENLVSFMEEHPATEDYTVKGKSWEKGKSNLISFSSFFPSTIPAVPAVLAIILIFFGGVSFAAQSSLPGDFLYPVKTGFNEEIGRVLSFSDEGKAEWEVEVTKRRLEEAEKLSVKGEMNNEKEKKVALKFEANFERARNHINELWSKDKEAAAKVASDLEATLRAHNKIMVKISEKEEHVLSILSHLEENKRRIASDRKEMETNMRKEYEFTNASDTFSMAALEESATSNKSNQGLRNSAYGKLNASINKLREVEIFIESKKSKLSDSEYSEAKNKLKEAQSKVEEGRTEIENENYANSFALFQESKREAQEAKVFTQASVNLQLNMNFDLENSDNDKDGEKNEEQSSSDENATTTKNSTTTNDNKENDDNENIDKTENRDNNSSSTIDETSTSTKESKEEKGEDSEKNVTPQKNPLEDLMENIGF